MSDIAPLTCIEKRSASCCVTRFFQRHLLGSDTAIPTEQCVYVAADIGALLTDPYCVANSTARRNEIISYLLSISDRNCDRFRSRVCANKAGLDTNKNVLQDLTTAAAAAATFPFPAAAVALNVTNVIVGKTITQIDATYFSERTFSAMDDAITSKRNSARAEIRKRESESPADYTIMDALAAIGAYDEICSIKGGVDELAALAAKAKTNSGSPTPSDNG